MKFMAVILWIGCMHAYASGHSQNITLAKKNVTLQKVFKEINRQTGYKFLYQDELLEKAGTISIQVKNTRLTDVLAICFRDLPLGYTISHNTIVVVPRNSETPLPTVSEPLPPVEVRGLVTDEAGIPLAGASIRVKGSERGVASDATGRFSIKMPGQNGVLVVSFVGYDEKEVPITGSGDITIVLKMTDAKPVEEVVVVGYGTQKKVNVTGAVATVTSKDFAERPVSGAVNALQGKMAGVTITTTNGQPGRDDGTIRIRGIGAGLGPADVRASAAPLVIIDGVPGSLSDINPNDIDNISVLKDAASSAIYGARASNGVVLVTTRKGKAGHIQVRYTMYAGTQKATSLPDFLPSWQQAELYNEALKNEGRGDYAKWSADDIQKFKDGSDKTGAHPNTDWLDLLYTEPGWQQNHNVSINGGDAKTKYMFSLGYLDRKGNVKKVRYQKYNALFNINSQFTKKLSMNAGIGFLFAPFSEPVSTYATSFGQIIRMANRISNTVPNRWENGAYGYVSDGSFMAWLDAPSINKWQNYTVTGNAGLDYSPIEGLHLRPSFGYRLGIGQQQQYVADIQYYSGGAAGTPLEPTRTQGPNNLRNFTDRTTYTLVQGVADYEKKLGQHQFKILAGGSQEYSRYNDFSATRQDFLNNSLSEIDAGPQLGQQTSGKANDWGLQSVFGRINYNFDERYLFEANLRFDGSSRFAPGHRWGTFPSASAGWVISNENFFGSLKNTLSLLKLRGFWGKLGNQQIPNNYAYFETIAGGQKYSFNQTLFTGVAPDAGGNPLVTWEQTESFGIGVDAGLLRNKLNLSVDWFVRNTDNPLMPAQAGKPYAFKPPYVNVDGGLSNKGIEVTLGYRNRAGEFQYEVNGNFSYIENKVTKLTGGKVIDGSTFYDVGTPFNSLYGYEAIGIYQTQADLDKYPAMIDKKVTLGDIIYKDQNGDNKIDANNDRVYLGTYFPKVNYGFTLAANWKNFDLSVFFQGAAAVKAMGGTMIGMVGPDVQKPTSVFLDRWTPENHSTVFPRLWYSYTQNSPTTNPSSFWVKDASYLRLKNLMLGYNIPQRYLNHLGISNIKLYYSGQNLLTITKFYKWIDPEIGSTASINNYPQMLINSFGINVTF
ncbi:TonB-dependent receptor [Niabella hirudinis]|uniref:TonB-dependent receptor n=1 Tax=Niabella hirudinis TaxID=1285929 RepID=UPI003EB7030D